MKIKISDRTGTCKVKQALVVHMRLPRDLRKFQTSVQLNKEPIEIYVPPNAAPAKHISARSSSLRIITIYASRLVVGGIGCVARITKTRLAINKVFRTAEAGVCGKIGAIFKIALVAGKVTPVLRIA